MSLHSLPNSDIYFNCLHTGSQFVAIAGLGGFFGEGTHAARSSDGETWTDVTIPSGNWGGYYRAFAYDAVNDALCALHVRNSLSSPRKSIVSLDGGVTWNTYDLPLIDGSQGFWNSLAANDTGRIVAFGISSFSTPTPGLYCAYSDDGGITWTGDIFIAPAPTSNPSGACWNGSVFLMVNSEGGDGNTVYTSPDGITWTESFLPSVHYWLNPVWNGTVFMIGTDEASGVWVTSPDGITWTEYLWPNHPTLFNMWYSNAAASGVFCSVGPNEWNYFHYQAMFSFDNGKSWRAYEFTEDQSQYIEWDVIAAHPTEEYFIAIYGDVVVKFRAAEVGERASRFLLMFP